MSYTILQSTKIFTFIDKSGNRAVVSGYVGDCNNVSPKDFRNVKFNRAATCKGELSVEAAMYAEDVITGNIQLKNGGKTTAENVEVVVRRFLRNLNLAKTIGVESILYSEGKVRIILGAEGLEYLKAAESSLRFDYYDAHEQFALRLVEGDESDHGAYCFIAGSKRSIEDAVELSLTNSYLPAFFAPGAMTEDQLVTLLKNTSTWVHRYIHERTTTRLSKETVETRFTDAEKKEFSLSAFTQQ